jgi:hypothetical protein
MRADHAKPEDGGKHSQAGSDARISGAGSFQSADCFDGRRQRACGWPGAQGIWAAGISCINGSTSLGSTTQQS